MGALRPSQPGQQCGLRLPRQGREPWVRAGGCGSCLCLAWLYPWPAPRWRSCPVPPLPTPAAAWPHTVHVVSL